MQNVVEYGYGLEKSEALTWHNNFHLFISFSFLLHSTPLYIYWILLLLETTLYGICFTSAIQSFSRVTSHSMIFIFLTTTTRVLYVCYIDADRKMCKERKWRVPCSGGCLLGFTMKGEIRWGSNYFT